MTLSLATSLPAADLELPKIEGGTIRGSFTMRAVSFTLTIVLLTIANTRTSAEDGANGIAVSAHSEVKVPPDEVLLQLSVYTENLDLLTAKAENDRITRAVLRWARCTGLMRQDSR